VRSYPSHTDQSARPIGRLIATLENHRRSCDRSDVISGGESQLGRPDLGELWLPLSRDPAIWLSLIVL
jgi:hypothetical protein